MVRAIDIDVRHMGTFEQTAPAFGGGGEFEKFLGCVVITTEDQQYLPAKGLQSPRHTLLKREALDATDWPGRLPNFAQ